VNRGYKGYLGVMLNQRLLKRKWSSFRRLNLNRYFSFYLAKRNRTDDTVWNENGGDSQEQWIKNESSKGKVRKKEEGNRIKEEAVIIS
jgi:hypothetical protein